MRALRSAASVLASLALLVGVPWLLATTIGNPLDRLPDLLAGDVNDHVVLAALATALYLAWAQFAVAFAVELVSAVRRTPMPRRIPGVFAGQQGLARALVSGALLLLPVTASTVAPAAQAVAMSTTYQPVRLVTHLVTSPSAGSDVTSTQATASPTTTPAAPTRSVVLTEAGARTWWDLAATHLGDGTAWRDLWDLNHGRVQADGTVLTTERVVLQPGWTVLVPATANDTTGPAVAAVAYDSLGVEVTVEVGDTMSEIAADHGIHDWTRVWPFNAGRAEPDGARFNDPDHIEPGWTITIPTPTDMGDNTGHTPGVGDNVGDNATVVAVGDTLSQIAADHGVPLDAVVAANIGRIQADGSQLADPDDIRPGWRLVIPADVTPAVVTPADPGTTASAGPAPGSGTQPVPEPAVAPAPAPPFQPGPLPELPAVDGFGGTERATTPPATAPSTGRDTSASATTASTDRTSQTPVVPWIAGAGLLAGGTLLALMRHRRRQFRYRSPGRSITQTPPELRDAERVLLTAGGSGMGDVTFLDRALRGLTRAAADDHARPPEVVAARLTTDILELILAVPNDEPPAPWNVAPSGMAWTLNRTDLDLDDDGDIHRDYYAPYPTLVSIGHTPNGEQWLLDLEHVGYLSLTGDTERCMDLARFIAAELAHNTWSDTVDVTLVGFGAEMTALNPERLTHTDHLNAATAAATRALADDIADRDATGRTVLDARSAPGTGEVPAPHVTLVSPAAARDVQADGSLTRLLDDLRCHPGRAAVAVVFATGDNDGIGNVDSPDARSAGSWSLRVDQDGTLIIPALGEELIAQQLPQREAGDLAALLALAAVTEDHPMPPARGDQPWDEYCDAAGNPLPELTVPASAAADPLGTEWDAASSAGEAASSAERGSSVLPLPPRAYFERTAADEADLIALAPRVPDNVRQRIETSDTDLDVDVADWYDNTTTRPRITVLGPIQVRAQGELPAGRPRLAWHTEVITFLATRPRGATVEEFGTALWPDEPDVANKPKLRNSIYVARKWLGTDPNTGQDHLPSNTRSGGGAYRIVGGLLDWELFRRLRLRGVARGEHGIPDLRAALNLVTGVPFDRQRPGGYGWLVDPALDHEITATISDTAHLVATHHLAAGEPALAASAAAVALLAGSTADTILLDLVDASDAVGNTAEGDAYVKRIMANHDAEVEEDLPPRTAAILRRRRLYPPAA